jgi:hypothetical protein
MPDPELDRKVLELRKAGASLDQIANALDITAEDANTRLRQSLRELTQDSDEDLRLLEIERLDAMQRALWPKALSGSWLAVDRCLAIMERRSQLLSLDGARPAEVTHDAVDALAQRRATRIASASA